MSCAAKGGPREVGGRRELLDVLLSRLLFLVVIFPDQRHAERILVVGDASLELVENGRGEVEVVEGMRLVRFGGLEVVQVVGSVVDNGLEKLKMTFGGFDLSRREGQVSRHPHADVLGIVAVGHRLHALLPASFEARSIGSVERRPALLVQSVAGPLRDPVLLAATLGEDLRHIDDDSAGRGSPPLSQSVGVSLDDPLLAATLVGDFADLAEDGGLFAAPSRRR